MSPSPTVAMFSPSLQPSRDTSSMESVRLIPYAETVCGSWPCSVVPYTLPILNPPPTAGDPEVGLPGGSDLHFSASIEWRTSGGTSMGPGSSPWLERTFLRLVNAPQIPKSTEDIEEILLVLAQPFGFQKDAMQNIVRPRYLSLLPCAPPLYHASSG